MSNAKIVIVDANTKTLKDVARVLGQAGYEVTTATSGREGERVVASCRPHLVLLDFVLPDIPGTEVLRRIKADPASNGVSVVLMSSLFGTTLEHSADLDADADGYIVRPISSRELLARVRGILRQRELVRSLRASETRYRDQAILLSNAQRMGHMGSWSLDIADERMVWSDETCALFGIAPDEFRGTREHFYSFVLPEDRPRLNADYSRVVTSGGLLDVESEFRIRRPDGEVRWMMVRGNAHLDADGSVGRRFGMYMDITDRKHAEERILRLNRVYALLSALSAVLARIPDQQHLFDTACLIAVDTGKMHAAMIGLLDADTGEARMVAQAGNIRDYHKEIRVSGAIGPFGGGPFGIAMREGRSVVCNDIENDPTFAPWRESALKRGFKSVGVFPLKLNGRTFGGYAHYADVPNFFDAEEVRLLDELAANISFAVEYLEKEQRRQSAEAALRESEERLRAIYEQAAVGICLISLDYRFERVNRRFCEILGCDADYLLKFLSSIDATHPDDREADAQAVAKLLAGATSITLEKRYLTRENQVVWVRLTLSVLRSPHGDPRKFIGVIEDPGRAPESRYSCRCTSVF